MPLSALPEQSALAAGTQEQSVQTPIPPVQGQPEMQAGAAEKTAATEPAGLQAPEMESQSWGTRFKNKAFNFATYFLGNYVVNTALAASIAYFFEHRFGKAMDRAIENNMGKSGAANGVAFALRAILLTSGGTALLVPIKHAEENREEYQYKLSKMLDKTQKALGMSNPDTERNLEEYKIIEDVALAIKKGEDPSVSVDEVKRLEDKYHLTFKDNGDIEFDKIKKPWGKLLLTRLVAIGAAMGMNGILGATTGRKPTEEEKAVGNYGEKGFGKILTDWTPKVKGWLSHIPGFGKLGDQNLAANILLNDAVLTVASSGMHFATDKFLEGKAEHKVLADMDVDKDGWVTRKEAEAYIEKKFAVKDKNADGRIASGVEGQRRSARSAGWAAGKAAASHTEKVESDRQNAKDGSAEIVQ